ncbi:methionyl-tRNA formyltransferase [Gramella sp. BOM4]|nr:methionyl-tRNA formyltransferase [Christiangramia bathymodioli]
MKIIVYTDSTDSWYVPYGHQLKEKLAGLGHDVNYLHHPNDLYACDIMFILSCTKLLGAKYLDQNKHNIVVHASDLPLGKGFSPLQWQILEGKNIIPLTLFEAAEAVDNGPFYIKGVITFEGHELLDELRKKMSEKINEMCIRFAEEYRNLKPTDQIGNSTFYRKRTEKDDELDVMETIANQFNHLRIADNDNYPLFFRYQGNKYYLKIYKDNNQY